MKIRIVCDSTCDMTAVEAQENKVTLVPLKVLFGTEEYFDGLDLTPDVFYEKLGRAAELPTTSQPSPEAFLRIFEEAKEQQEAVLCLLLAGKLSGTYQSAMIAREMADYDSIFLVDSETATLGTRLLLDLALRLIREGKSAAETAAVLEREKKKIRIYLVVETLDYLKKGGRLSAAGAAAGKVLNLKPVLCVSGGTVQVCGVARGRKGAYEKIWQQAQADGADYDRGFYVGYTGDPSCMDAFLTFLQQKTPRKERGVVSVGSVIGVHVGPGANALAAFLR